MSDSVTLPIPLPSSAEAEDQVLALEGFLPYRLNVLATEVSQALARAYGERFGIAIPEWRVLATLGQFGTATAREVGLHSRMHKTTVSRAVATLKSRDFIIRTTNRDDMREAFLTMSEKGRKVYSEIVPMAQHFSETLCAGLTPVEQAAFATLLAKLLERVFDMTRNEGSDNS